MAHKKKHHGTGHHDGGHHQQHGHPSHAHHGAHGHHGRKVHGGHKHQGGGAVGSHHLEQGYDTDTHSHQAMKKGGSRKGKSKSNETGLLNRGPAMHIGAVTHDAAAHPSFHAANKEHGLDHDFSPPHEGYMDGGCNHHLGDNVAHED